MGLSNYQTIIARHTVKPNHTIQALIISAMDWGFSYHQLKSWKYDACQRDFIKKYCIEGKDRLTGDIKYLRYIMSVS